MARDFEFVCRLCLVLSGDRVDVFHRGIACQRVLVEDVFGFGHGDHSLNDTEYYSVTVGFLPR